MYALSTKNFTITIQGDSEGYVTFECPYCDSEFKLQAEEYQNDDEPVLPLLRSDKRKE